jgi:hypothetical protein
MNNGTRKVCRQWHSALVAGFVLAFFAYTGNGVAADKSIAKPQDVVGKSNDVVVAKVDGTPIYQSEVNAGLPMDWFGASDNDLKNAKFERLIWETIVARFLSKTGMKVESAEIDAAVEDLRKNPPSAGCMCCRFVSLEQFMSLNGYDMAELRREIANNIGMDRHLAAEWNKSSAGVDKASDQVAARVRSEYMKVSHIFFNTFQKPDSQKDPEKVRNVALSKAKDALQRLANGDTFEHVAAAMSEDALSNRKGGLLGCIPREAFDPAFAAAVDNLKPGECSKPVETQWGVHVIRRETMTDADILNVVRDEYVSDKMRTIRRDLINAADVERLWKPK